MMIMRNNRVSNLFFAIIILLIFGVFTNCSKLKNPFKESSIIPPVDTCGYSGCHPASPLRQTDPVSGSHTTHLNRGYNCDMCHIDYYDRPVHMNAVQEAQSVGVVVFFDPVLGTSEWNDINNTCSITCHGNVHVKWYTGSSGAGCVACHSVSQGSRRGVSLEFDSSSQNSHFGQNLDNNACLVCHDQSTHMDGWVDLFAQDEEYTEAFNSSLVSIYRFQQVQNLSQEYDLSNFCIGCHDSDGATRLGANALDPFNKGNSYSMLSSTINIAERLSGTLQWVEMYGSGLGARGTQRRVNSHHDINYDDQMWSGSRVECYNCHGAHSATKTRPLVDPFDTSRPWDYNPGNGTASQINSFCLSCHSGGDDGKPILPAGVIMAGSTKTILQQTLEFDPSGWQDYNLAYGPGYSCAWVNTGEWVDTSANCISDPSQYGNGTMNTPDSSCYSDPNYKRGIVSGGMVPWSDDCGGLLAPKTGVSVFMEEGLFEVGDTITFKYCSQFGGLCSIDEYFYFNGWATITNATISLDLSGDVSLMRGINSDSPIYSSEPWSVGHKWDDSKHGPISVRDGVSDHESYKSGAPSQYAYELKCTDCHDSHGSYTASNPEGNPYAIRDRVDGSMYLDDGYKGNYFTLWDVYPVPKDVVITIPGDTTLPFYQELCLACHYTGYSEIQSGTGGHADWENMRCSLCHQHGGSSGGN
ncbi:hypothetical protein ACFL20_04210 [Spirochaetota bacterium]